MYADDTSLTVSTCDLDTFLTEINSHLIAVYNWLNCNNLHIIINPEFRQN